VVRLVHDEVGPGQLAQRHVFEQFSHRHIHHIGEWFWIYTHRQNCNCL
jgi:hypothetical protein